MFREFALIMIGGIMGCLITLLIIMIYSYLEGKRADNAFKEAMRNKDDDIQ